MKGAERLEREFQGALEEIERSEIRPRQKATYMCAAKCCDVAKSQNELANCTNRCSTQLTFAQQVVEAHVGQLQARLERCSARCQDIATERFGGQGAPDAEARDHAQKTFDTCVDACAEETLQLLKRTHQDITRDLASSSSTRT
ncbi:Uncharacterized protein FVE85_6496 [Porphyridium purpureum]|uniref:Protein FAM136A n=1 Tax=Porphyridium purpureum TaxID=35688 RepID=A0A5J4Z4W4_PORPP|nr:Uncharacterized protein FVE85_6496 [Porphyridium purpureum]|eukprot:POR6209..scf295_1